MVRLCILGLVSMPVIMLSAAVVTTLPTAAEAKRLVDWPNYGYCQDGRRFRNVARCPENRGKSVRMRSGQPPRGWPNR